MTQTATPKRKTATRKGSTATRKRSAAPSTRTASEKPAAAAKRAARKPAVRAARVAGPGTALELFKATRRTTKALALARHFAGVVRDGVQSDTFREAAGLMRELAVRAAADGRELLTEELTPGLPIQRAVDVAVPLEVAWREWMALDFIPEGIGRVEKIDRDGDELTGELAGRRPRPWEAMVLDERECESFAWRSVRGSDCAGLMTFHRLSERLTRLELNLDVVPGTPAEGLALTSHLAARRTELDLRRFKARVELISPDAY